MKIIKVGAKDVSLALIFNDSRCKKKGTIKAFSKAIFDITKHLTFSENFVQMLIEIYKDIFDQNNNTGHCQIIVTGNIVTFYVICFKENTDINSNDKPLKEALNERINSIAGALKIEITIRTGNSPMFIGIWKSP
ncbi:MAG: hypothetical protein WCW14_02010 [Candidatus Paceibacterota bacterium]|jgi:hypothetical protein